MVELVRRRRPERKDLTALRIGAVEPALDRAVLAGRVHALEDQQQRPAVLRVEFALEIGEPLAVRLDDLLALVLVEAALLSGLVRFEMKLARSVEAKRRDVWFQFCREGFALFLAHQGTLRRVSDTVHCRF